MFIELFITNFNLFDQILYCFAFKSCLNATVSAALIVTNIETFENRTIAENSHYLVSFGNRTLGVIALIEAALTGDPCI